MRKNFILISALIGTLCFISCNQAEENPKLKAETSIDQQEKIVTGTVGDDNSTNLNDSNAGNYPNKENSIDNGKQDKAEPPIDNLPKVDGEKDYIIREPGIFDLNGNCIYTCDEKMEIDENGTLLFVHGDNYQSDDWVVILPKNVVKIGENAFHECCNQLISVDIPNSVTEIGQGAFYGCSLVSIIIPNSVTQIGSEAFFSCMNLSSISIPNGVTEIRKGTFFGCYNLKKLVISDSVASIEESAFQDCENLSSITVSDKNLYFDSRNNCNAIIRKIDNQLILGCNTSIIPDTVTGIGDGAFSRCQFTDISIPNGVQYIGANAFSFCRNLTNVNLPESIVEIGSHAFLNCKNLISIYLPNNIAYIGVQAFDGCSGLISIIVPSSVTKIEAATFLGCKSLFCLTLPDNITEIGDDAFLATNLSQIRVSKGSVTEQTLKKAGFQYLIYYK